MSNEKFINWLETWFKVAEKNISESDISIIKGHFEHFSNQSINRDDLKNGPESYFDQSGQPIYYVTESIENPLAAKMRYCQENNIINSGSLVFDGGMLSTFTT